MPLNTYVALTWKFSIIRYPCEASSEHHFLQNTGTVIVYNYAGAGNCVSAHFLTTSYPRGPKRTGYVAYGLGETPSMAGGFGDAARTSRNQLWCLPDAGMIDKCTLAAEGGERKI